MKVFIALVCLILGASLNEWAAKQRLEGIHEGLTIVGNRIAEDYQEFSHKRASIEAFIQSVCADSFYRRARAVNLNEVCEP